MSSLLVGIGTIARAHGLRGLVRVRPFGDGASLATARRVLVAGVPRAVEQVLRDGGGVLLKLAGVDDRDAADALRGAEVALPRDELPPAAADEVYVADLVGCALVDRSGAVVGVVRAVSNHGGQELLIVDGARGEVLVPFVEPLIESVDLGARRIVCDPPEGLLDLGGGP